MKQFAVISIVAALFFLGVKCTPGHSEEHGSHHLLEKLDQLSADSLHYDFSRFDHLDKAKLVQIHQPIAGTAPFFIPDRKAVIKSFPCSNCHSKSLEALQQGRGPNEKKSHWDIELIHAKASTMLCTTCHNPNNFNYLQSLTGEPVEFDHSYQLCGQCHSIQLKDWLGGAHGKQVGGWAPPRVSQTCTGCHNPHKPAFEKRLPSRYNSQMAK